jgi:hypothetical protein
MFEEIIESIRRSAAAGILGGAILIAPAAAVADYHPITADAQQVVDLTLQLLGYDLWNATYWMDVRKAQDPSRSFGPVPTAAWTAFRRIRLRPTVVQHGVSMGNSPFVRVS